MLLHTKSKLFSLHRKMQVRDEHNRVLYTVSSKFFSIHGTTYVRKDGRQIAVLTHKPISMHETHFLEMASGERVAMQTELFHLMDDVIRIEGLGWTLHGDLFRHNYELRDANGSPVAAVRHKWISLHDRYEIEIAADSEADRVVCLTVMLEQIIRDRQQRRMNN